MPLVKCPICWEYHPLEKLRVLKCGHGACQRCIGQILSRPRPSCSTCRTPFTADGAITIYGVEFVHESVALASDTVLGVKRMGADSKEVSIRAGVERVTQTTEALKEELGGLSEDLLNELREFGQRVAPELLKFKEMAKDLQELHTQNETFRSKTREQERELHRLRPQMETLRSEAHSTKGKHAREMAQACKERDEAIGLAEQIAKDILHERKMNETKEQELVALRADLHQAKTRLDQHVTKATKDKRKMEGLKQENDSLRKELQALQKETNESMLIVTDDYDDLLPPSPSQQHIQLPSSPATHQNPRKRAYSTLTQGYMDESLDFAFQGLPKPFGKPRVVSEGLDGVKKVRVKPPSFSSGGLKTDKNGKLLSAVQTGPKHSFRIPQTRFR